MPYSYLILLSANPFQDIPKSVLRLQLHLSSPRQHGHDLEPNSQMGNLGEIEEILRVGDSAKEDALNGGTVNSYEQEERKSLAREMNCRSFEVIASSTLCFLLSLKQGLESLTSLLPRHRRPPT